MPTATAAAATRAAIARTPKTPLTDLPPKPPQVDRTSALLNLQLIANGRPYLIGPAIQGDPQMDATKDSSATLTIIVADPNQSLISILADESVLLAGAVTCTLNGIVYTLMTVDSDQDANVTLTMEDQVSWRLRQFTKPLSVKRSQATRAEFFAMLVDEASKPPLAPMAFFCPEIDDTQRITAPATTTTT